MDILKNMKKLSEKFTKTIGKLEKEYEVSGKIDSLKDKAEDLYDDVKDKAGDAVDAVSEKIEAKMENKITFDDFAKVELKIGKILSAEDVKKSKKLLKLSVDFGEENPRQIISGIKEYYEAEKIKGKTALFATNLLPRKIMGLESDGMILGLKGEKEFSVLVADKKKLERGVQAG